MAAAMPQSAHELDIQLAEEILGGEIPPCRDAHKREQRDLRWILGLLGFRGLHVTERDVAACLEGRPGRFRPEHPEAAWIRGFRAAIDEIDRRAERGEGPDGAGLSALFAIVTKGHDEGVDALRRELPWERVPGMEYTPAARIADELTRFSVMSALDAEGIAESSRVVHPVRASAAICRHFVRLSPFRDFNLPVACLAASWELSSRGYPPFLVHGGDRGAFLQLLCAPLPVWEQWFAEMVYTSHLASR